MKRFLALLFFAAWTSLNAGTHSDLYNSYGELLSKYVKPSGVDYQSWVVNDEDVDALYDLLMAMSIVDVDSLSDDEQQAFYINLYNAAMIQAVLENYPLKTVTTILPGFGIFEKKYIQLGDRVLSLNEVEKSILLERWDEPRIHFAVNCASASCPPLRNEPFTGEKLETQLQEQTEQFAETKHALRLDRKNRTAYVSSLFDWYADDFPGDSPLHYLNRYRQKSIPTRYKVKFINYDWSLNEAKN
ncbi:MAG: DUF547 domain-containing protein [Verrucomicrobiota bacterium]